MPQQVNFAVQKALNGKPGPVYLDFPGDVLYTTVDEADVDWSYGGREINKARPYAESQALNASKSTIAVPIAAMSDLSNALIDVFLSMPPPRLSVRPTSDTQFLRYMGKCAVKGRARSCKRATATSRCPRGSQIVVVGVRKPTSRPPSCA